MTRLLELFSGTAILSQCAEVKGWKTLTVDNDVKCAPNLVADISINNDELMQAIYDFNPHVIWASPPCESFSVASIGTHWGGGHRMYAPRTEQAKRALKLLTSLANLIEDLDPKVWYIENPRGVMRKVNPYHAIEGTYTTQVLRHTVTYCQYNDDPGISGLPRMKPTDIWTNNLLWEPRPMCKNGAPCHEAAPRGAKTGTQGRSSYLSRSKLPVDLCYEVLDAAEEQLIAQKAALQAPCG